jgi:phosphohistidine phosphatase
MKLLSLVRHAKSSGTDLHLSDFERPLSKSGERNAPVMGRKLAATQPRPDLFVSSPAKRALATARIFAAEAAPPAPPLALERDLYEADVADFLRVIRGLDPAARHVAIFAHNPTLTEVANRLSDAEIVNVPTCGLVRIRLNVERWDDVSERCGALEGFDRPEGEAVR